MDILRIEHLSKIYGKGDTEVRALDDVSFTANSGEILGIAGISGAGHLSPPPNRSHLSVLQFDSHFDRRGKYDAALAAG